MQNQIGRFEITVKTVDDVERKLSVLQLKRKESNQPQRLTFFVHGAGGRIKQYQSQIDHLINNGISDIVALDFMGHGDSFKSDLWKDYCGKQFVQDVCFFFDAFWRWNRANSENDSTTSHHLVAHSYGGALSLLALLHLKNNSISLIDIDNDDNNKKIFDSVTLIAPAVFAPLAGSFGLYCTPVMIMNLFRQKISDEFNAKCYHSKTDQKIIAQQVEENSSNSLYMMKALMYQMHVASLTELQSTSLPCRNVLIVEGEEDQIITANDLKQLLSALRQGNPNITVETCVIKDAGHLPMVETPATLNEILEKQIK